VLSHVQIQQAVQAIAGDYPFKRVSYFGSYAEGRQTEGSDLDVLVEFQIPAVSLITLSEIKYRLEDALKTPVDIIHAPIPKGALIEIVKEVAVYEQ
jgi:hypothetical protein